MDNSQLPKRPPFKRWSQGRSADNSGKRRLFCNRHLAITAGLIIFVSALKIVMSCCFPWFVVVNSIIGKTAGLAVAICYMALGIEHLMHGSIDTRDLKLLHRFAGLGMVILGLSLLFK